MKNIKIMLANKEIKVNNSREEKLVRVINNRIADCERYLEESSFGDKTASVVERNMKEVDSMLAAMFYMNIIHNWTSVDILDPNSLVYKSVYWWMEMVECEENAEGK